MGNSNYECVSLIIEGVVGGAIILTFFIYYRQLLTMRKSSEAVNSIAVINYLQDEDAREARRYVMTDLNRRPFDAWMDDDKIEASKVCSTYTVVSILVLKQKLVHSDLIIENWHSSIIKCYRILEDFIKDQQNDENFGPMYWDDFKKLYDKAIEFTVKTATIIK